MDQVAEVRNKTDIVGLISQYLTLKKMGRNFKVNCPFHGEKTPSFVVSPERQIWHCFGCQRGGDCFTFLMEYEHMEFPEALRILADKAGVILVSQKYDAGAASKKEKLYALNRLSAEFYHYLLTKHKQGEKAYTYLSQKRHVLPQTMDTFLLGFAPVGGALATYLIKKKKYTPADLVEAGLAVRRNNNTIVDFFQDRIIFTLFDHRDNIIGFSGRIMEDREKSSKYINTRETLVYHKGMTFFGFNIAKNAIKKQNQALLMEGEFDVISSFQEGITNAIAVKGTAVTPDQVSLLSRFCQNISLCFDKDAAGKDALKRSLGLFEEKGMTVSVVSIPDAKDADEAIQKNAVTFKQAVKHALGVYDYLLEEALKEISPRSVTGKKQITDLLLPFFAAIENEIVKEHYLKELAQKIDTSYEALVREIEKLKKQEVTGKIMLPQKTYRMREDMLEEYLVSLIVQSDRPKILLEAISDKIHSYTWHTRSFQHLLEKLTVYVKSHEVFDQREFVHTLPEELIAGFDTCFLLPLPSFADGEKYKEEVIQVAKELQERSMRHQIKLIGEEIKKKEKEKNFEEIEQLQQELQILVSRFGQKP